MNSNDIDDSKPATQAAGPADNTSDAPAKPKRTRKAAAAPAEVSDPVAAPATEETSKPRARRKVVATAEASAEAPATEAPIAEAADAAEAAEAPKPRRRTTKKAAEAEVAPAEAASAVVHVPVATVEVSPAPVSPVAGAVGELVSQEAHEPRDAGPVAGDQAEGVEAEAEAGGEREGRGRNRRRRGRDRDREPRDGQPAQPQGDAAEAAEGDDAARADSAQLQAEAQARFDALVSGAFDDDVEGDGAAPAEPVDIELSSEEGSEASDQPAKRVLAPDADAPKLQKVLAQAGVGSRRDIEDMIAKGQITVNGEVAHVGQRISYGDRVAVAGKPIKVRIAPVAPRILAYHKPVGEVVTFNDPEGRPTVFRNLPRLPQGKWQSVGRLDLNTEGLLLFTNSGELANQLMHPRFGVEREYAVRVLGSLSKEQKDTLLTGVDVDGQQASFKSIEDGGGEGVNRWYRVVITEGRNREVRKLFESVGLAVSRLIRIRYGTVVLPRGLRRGVYIELGDADVRVIRQLAGNEPRPPRNNDRNDRGDKRRRGNSGGPRPSRPEPSRNEHRGDQRGERQESRADRQDRQDRPDRQDRQDRPQRNDRNDQRGQSQRPQQQQQERERDRRPRDEDDDDFIPKHINPLEQTFDRRFATGSKRIPQGFGKGGSDADHHSHRGNQRGPGGERQPDPMKTSIGYIGADAFINRGGNRGGGRRGGGGGGGGGGGRGRR